MKNQKIANAYKNAAGTVFLLVSGLLMWSVFSDMKAYGDPIAPTAVAQSRVNPARTAAARKTTNARSTIARSTVEEDTYCTGKILWDTWNVHTIADCYMNEFEDSTGSYVYVPNNITHPENAADAKLTCYYSQTVTGSSLYYK